MSKQQQSKNGDPSIADVTARTVEVTGSVSIDDALAETASAYDSERFLADAEKALMAGNDLPNVGREATHKGFVRFTCPGTWVVGEIVGSADVPSKYKPFTCRAITIRGRVHYPRDIVNKEGEVIREKGTHEGTFALQLHEALSLLSAERGPIALKYKGVSGANERKEFESRLLGSKG